MLRATIRFYDNQTPINVVMGVGEDVKAPRALAALEQQGWVVDDDFALTYKAWLAAKRQGDLPADSKFEDWVDSVAEIDARPSIKQIEQAVALGNLERDKADRLIAVLESDEGEAEALPAS